MQFEWDYNKNSLNIKKHSVAFDDAGEMFKNLMLVLSDQRNDYGEIRYIGIGSIKNRIMVVIFTKPQYGIIRIISLRKANKREQEKFKSCLKNRLETY